MFREIYYEHSGACDARSIAFLAVRSCKIGVLRALWVHGKTPWFKRCCFSLVFGVDSGHYILGFVDGGKRRE